MEGEIIMRIILARHGETDIIEQKREYKGIVIYH